MLNLIKHGCISCKQTNLTNTQAQDKNVSSQITRLIKYVSVI